MDVRSFGEVSDRGGGFPSGSVVKIHLSIQKTQVRSLGWEDTLE